MENRTPTTDSPLILRAYVVSSVTSAAAALEAMVNEAFADASESEGSCVAGLRPDAHLKLGHLWAVPISSRFAIVDKYPVFLFNPALLNGSPDGHSYSERIAALKTERQISELFDEMIAQLPFGEAWLSDKNPVRTAGPMQVSIAFAEQHAARKPYSVFGAA